MQSQKCLPMLTFTRIYSYWHLEAELGYANKAFQKIMFGRSMCPTRNKGLGMGICNKSHMQGYLRCPAIIFFHLFSFLILIFVIFCNFFFMSISVVNATSCTDQVNRYDVDTQVPKLLVYNTSISLIYLRTLYKIARIFRQLVTEETLKSAPVILWLENPVYLE